MSPLVVAAISFGCILGAALVGIAVGPKLPGHHLESNSKDVVRLSMGMIATMTALVLGLVTGSAKSAFDAEDSAIKGTAANVLSLDRMLADYGPETKDIRGLIQKIVMAKVEQVWPEDQSESALVAPTASHPSELIIGQILKLVPKDDEQQWYKSQALQTANAILQARWVVFSGAENSIPTLFLVVMVCWLTVLFGSFGLFAPRNATVIAALLICSLSVAASLFLILEMNDPFNGVMKISSAPMRFAVSHINQ
jgi:hypothetical protein